MISGTVGLATINILDNAGSPEWISMVAGLGVSFAGGYYGNKITGIGTAKESGEIKSFADLMSPEDAARYNGYFDEVLKGTHYLPGMDAGEYARYIKALEKLDVVKSNSILESVYDEILDIRKANRWSYEGVAETKGGSASDSYLFERYKESLVKGDVLNNSEVIIEGKNFGDKKLIAELTKDGSNIEDWAKMSSIYSYTNEYGTAQIHYYKNVKNGKVSYYDAKMKIPAPKLIKSRLKNTVTDKDGFWILELDENLIPIGVRK